MKLPNLKLTLLRVSSEIKPIKFSRGLDVLQEESTKFLEAIVRDLEIHPSLRLRVFLIRNDSNVESVEKKETILNDYFEKKLIDQDRLIFSEADEGASSDTVQIFDKK